MECLYCGFEFERSKKCPACGTDAVMMKKVCAISARLYNRGLAQAQVSDFYNAEISLRKSVEYDKQNYMARNLLGLVYFETGRLANALKEWIISVNFKEENNSASEYINAFQDDIREFEKLNEAVKMYNQAIKYLKKKNDDVAVIRLKKAIDINPGFIAARNLLTLCYIKQTKWAKAFDIANKTLEMDSGNPQTIRYIREINSVGALKKKSVNQKDDREPVVQPVYYSQGGKSSVLSKIVFMALGALLVGVVMSVLVFPASDKGKDDKINELNKEIMQLKNKYSAYQSETSAQLTELENENNHMQAVADANNKTDEKTLNVESLANAKALIDEGRTVEAAKILAAIDMTDADEGAINVYNELRAKSYSKACNELYAVGKEYFDKQDFENAKYTFNACITFGDSVPDKKYDAYYMLGKIAMNQNDTSAAEKYFSEVKNNHPNSSIKSYADNYLKTL